YPRRKEFSCGPRVLQFDAPANFARELTQHLIAIALLYDTLDPAVETVTVIARQILRSNHDDRYVLPANSFTQFFYKLESIHRRHHKVENDHVGLGSGQGVDCNPAVLGFSHAPPYWFERLSYRSADDFVIVDKKGMSAGRSADRGQSLH